MANSITSMTPPAAQLPATNTATIFHETAQVKQLTDGSLPGASFGQSSADNITFFNGTPIPQILQGSLAGAAGLLKVYTTSQSPASVASNTTVSAALTVTGVAATDMV